MADASMRDYGLAAPHGPNVTGEHVATADIGDMSDKESSVFRQLLLPDDSYTPEGIYWADLPLGKKIAFVNKVNNEEARKELASLGRMIKADPLSPLGYYARNMIIPGAGLLLEGYVLFSIGLNGTLFAHTFPGCWDTYTVCDEVWVQAVTYLEVVGIILGQIAVGIIGDWLGRRWGLIQDAGIMLLGLIMLVCSWGVTLNGWVICYALTLMFYSFGVGGEYPMTATSGMENAVGSGKISTRDDRLHRGRKVTSAFLMQGWGQFLNQVVLLICLLCFNGSSGNPPYDRTTAQWTYRIAFAVPAIGTAWLVYYRVYKMRSASKQLQVAKKKQSVTGYDAQSLKLTFTYFGPRLLATTFGWYCNDVFFYGNKLFQGTFIDAIQPAASDNISIGYSWNLINITVELVGYYLASFLIDNKLYGRKWMQIIGFMACFICFVIPAFNYEYYTTTAIHSFQAMYYISSFFNQFGPNAVTFLVAAEVFPTPIRASAHGFSAACGKLGALTAGVLYNYIGDRLKFRVVTWFGLGGALVTWLFLPDTTGLDLKEQERRWVYIRSGREHEYHGVAIHPRHLSVWERMRGVGKNYNAEEDYKQRVEELRADWEAAMARRAEEKAHDDDDDNMEEDNWSSEVSTFFERTGKNGSKSPWAAQQSGMSAEHPIDEKEEHHTDTFNDGNGTTTTTTYTTSSTRQ